MSKPTSDCRATERNHPWPMVRLGDVCKEIKDRIQSSKIAVDEYVTTDNMVKDRGGVVRAEYVPSGVGLVEYRKGDVLIANIRPYLKKIWLADHDGGCSSDVVVFRTNTDGLSSEYLYSVLSQDAYFEYVMQKPRGTKMPRGDRNWMKEFRFPLPPLPVQREIVARLERELAAVEKMKKGFEALAETAKAEFKAELKEVFEGLKRDGAGMRKIGDVCTEISTGPFGSSLHKNDYIVGGTPIINPMHIVGQRLIPTDNMAVDEKTIARLSAYCLRENDVIIGRRGEMGRAALVTSREKGWLCGTGCFFLRLRASVSPRYFVELLCSDYCKSQMEHQAIGTTIPNLNHTILREIEMPMPELAEQEWVVGSVTALRAKMEKLEAKAQEGVAICETMRKAILKEAFSPCGAGEAA